jgi:hypothetical protein
MEKLAGSELEQAHDRGKGVYSLHPSPAEPAKLVIVGVGQRHWATEDGGETYKVLNITADIREIQFHPVHHDWFLFSEKTPRCYNRDLPGPPCSLIVYVTPDFGRTFTKLAENVVQFGWGPKSMPPSTVLMTLYEPRNRPKDGMQFDIWDPLIDFVATTDFMHTHRVVVPHGNSFSIEGEFLFVAVVETHSKGNVVRLRVSSDGGRTFNPVEVPAELEQFGYTIVDASHGTAFLHVNHGTFESPYGTLYISDATGANYTLSLEQHARSRDGHTDFSKVQAHEGIYLANTLANYREVEDSLHPPETGAVGDNGDDDGGKPAAAAAAAAAEPVERQLMTVITFNKGADWSPIKAPTKDRDGKPIECENPIDGVCRLHLNGLTNVGGFGPFYSTKSAAGIILASGNTGDYLATRRDEMSAWISRDAGLSWSHVARGSFIYEIGDHGAVIVMATNDRPTNHVLFSLDEGETWHSHEFRKTGIFVTNIVNNPTSTATSFIIYGTNTEEQGVLVHVNFQTLKLRNCEGADAADSKESDYEKWTPGNYLGSTCLMGRTVSYVRRKQHSICWNGAEFERASFPTPCECTERDYECDYGYARSDKAGNPCEVVDPLVIHTAAKPATCRPGSFYEESFGYRLIGGDSCVGGVDKRPKVHPCTDMAFGSVSHRAFVVLLIFSLGGLALGAVTAYSRVDKFRMWVDDALTRLPWSVKQWKYEGLGSNRAPDTLLDDDEFDMGLEDDMDKVLGGSGSGGGGAAGGAGGAGGGGSEQYGAVQSGVTSNGYGKLVNDIEDDFDPRA